MKRTQARVTRKIRQAKRAARLQQQAKELSTIARAVQRESGVSSGAGSFLLGLGIGIGLMAAVVAQVSSMPTGDLKAPGLLKGPWPNEDAKDEGKDVGA